LKREGKEGKTPKMQFSTYVAIATLAVLTSAQNPFTFTTLTSITAGTPINITWAPSTGTVDTITLLLRQGDPTHLSTIATIARTFTFHFPFPCEFAKPTQEIEKLADADGKK